MSKVLETIESAITPTVESMGYRVVDVEITKENGNKILLITISKKGEKIGLNDCENVSKAVDPILDELDPIENAYYLCVSSPGIDRPLKRPADFEEAIGTEVEAGLYAPINGKKKVRGILTGFDKETMTMTITGEETWTLTTKQTTRVKPIVEIDIQED
ncbi:MAG: ribosome maturation factor RimP [Clostridia bacterium]|nr:ribosome maturation factor RimP [Clostridia bacterium]